MSVAFCYRSGEIEFARSLVPDGAIPFVRSRKGVSTLREIVEVRARRAYDGGLLVPGIPEADSDDAALSAFEKWKAWAFPEGRA